MVDERARLQMLLNRLQATLADADSRPAKSQGMAEWLRALKDAAYDIEDVLDEFEYEDLRRRVEAEAGSSVVRVGVVVSLLPLLEQVRRCLSFLGTRSLGEAMADRIADIWRRFDEILEDKKALDVIEELDGEEAEMEESADGGGLKEAIVSVSDTEMLGRDWEKDEAMGFLLENPTDDLSVLAIAGIGGLGKTMLASSVYDAGEVADYFDLKIWVHVSFDFDVKSITKRAIQQVADPNLMLHEVDSFDVLQVTLANALREKRFLLVLDDVWYEDDVIKTHIAWEALCAPLLSGGKGSKIVVTTRSTQVLGITQPVKLIKLQGLELEDSWSLFKKHAFDGHSGRNPNLEEIGERIVEKLDGVPLAVVAIGSLLRFKFDECEWTSVAQSELWTMEQGEGGILPALRVSYEHLQSHLKPCFAYCSVFRKGQHFDKLELLQLWMALGYIRRHRRRPVQEVGNGYLNCLVNRSLIQFVNGKYVVHDLLHDLGRSILQHEHRTIGTDQLRGITVEDQHKYHYHLRVLHKQADVRDLAKLQGFRKLRTCIFEFSHRYTFQVPSCFFVNVKCLRVLDLSSGGVHVLSDSIANLEHLRYLDLRKTPVEYLPESLCSLYMLQTLRIGGCDKLGLLPKGMCNLVNLHYLEAREELVSGISQIGKLTLLQQIDVFSIPEGNGIKIEDLKHLNELRGGLCIRNLHRVGSKEAASQANLSNKQHLNKLELEWVEDWDANERNSEIEEAVFDALVPPPNLKELTIKYYDGVGFPCWMKHQFISGLESISLCRCQRWDALPPLLCVLPFLKKLEISYFPQLTELPPVPNTLTYLRLQDVGLTDVPVLQELSLLQELILCNIPDLMELPPLPTTLRIFTVENLGLTSLPGFHQLHGVVTPSSSTTNDSSPLLRELKIAACQNLRSLGGVLREQLTCLTELSIMDCGELVCWPEEEGFRVTLLSLQEFSIENCPKLMALPEGAVLSPALKKLTVTGCPTFPNSSFFSQLQNMRNLTRQGDVYVEKQFKDFQCCSEEALKHMGPINWLIIQFVCLDGPYSPFVALHYDIKLIGRRRSLDSVHYRRVVILILGSSTIDEDYSSILSTCLHHHHLCSSLLSLCVDGMPYSVFLLPAEGGTEALLTPYLPTLEELVIVRCSDMRKLPVETMLRHLQDLKKLSIVGCSELTLLSVEAALQSLPPLELLVIIDCPKMLLPEADAHPDDGGITGMPSSSFAPASSSSFSSSPPPPLLQSLAINDATLLANRQFACNHLASLRELAIWYADLHSFPVAKEECLRSLRSLSFINCPKLQKLSPDLRSLAPSLEVLCVTHCPKLRCMPELGLPASLEVLAIDGSPRLEEDDWPKVSHVRLIVMEGEIVEGSYGDYQDLVTKGKAVVLPLKRL